MANGKSVVYFVGDSRMGVDGSPEEVADQLRSSNATPSGFIPLTTSKGKKVMVNRDLITRIVESSSAASVADVV